MTVPAPAPFRSSNVFLAPAVIVVFAVVAVAVPVAVILSLAAAAAPAGEWAGGLLVPAIVGAVLVVGCLSHHRVEVGDQAIRLIWFPGYRKTIPAHDIVAVGTERVSPWRYGLGLRLIGNATLAVMNRGGDAAVIGTIENRRYLVVIGDPLELAETLRRVERMIGVAAAS